MKKKLWKAVGIERERFEKMLIALPDHVIQEMKLDADADKLIQAMFESHQKEEKDMEQEVTKTKIIDFWKTYCGLNNNYEAFSVLAKFIEESDNLKQEIGSIKFQDFDKSYLLEEHNKLYTIFSPNNLNANVNNIQKSITNTLLLQLRMCKDVLEKHLYLQQVNELKLETELLNDILASSRQLLEEIVEYDVDPNLKLQLIECCNAIIWSIKHYKCLGTKDLKKAIIFSISILSENSEKLNEYQDFIFMKRISYITKRTCEALSFAKNVNFVSTKLPSKLQEIINSLPPSE